jgi:hypothetical protein
LRVKEAAMYRNTSPGIVVSITLVLGLVGYVLAASEGDVLINEIYPNSPTLYDGSEYIELYNTTGSTINLEGWVLSGTEFDGVCGEHHWQFPSGAEIGAHGYIVVARDVADGDGFYDRFGFYPDFEMYDNSESYEVNYSDLTVPNLVCQNPDSYDDQLKLIPGVGDYGMSCRGSYNRYEALFLFDSPSRTNLIDAMEYMNPTYCTSDQCPGVNVSDNDAFAGLPPEDLSIGRDEVGTDTNNSNADFHIEVKTPRAQNSTNVPPNVWNLRYSPCVPTPSDSINISCYATDEDGVQWVKCYYTMDDSSASPVYTEVAMYAQPSDSLYQVNLDPQPEYAQGKFYVKAADDSGHVSTYPGDAPEGAYRFAVGLFAIQVVQAVNQGAGEDSSYYAGKAVSCTGIVTAGRGVYSDYNFVIQNGIGPWSGIYVYDPTSSVPAEEGDSVTVSGWVSEYYNLTEIYMFSGCYTEHSSGNAVPQPVVIKTGDIGATSNISEQYEGVLIKVKPAEVTDDSLGFGEWLVNDNKGEGPCRVDDDAYYFYTPKTGDVLDSLQGVVNYSFSDYKIEPRGDDDIFGPLSLYTLRYAPHAPQMTDQVTVSVVVIADNPVSSVKLFYSTNGGSSYDSTSMSASDSLYSVVIGPYLNDTVVDYYVEAWDNAGYVGRKPYAGSYDFYVGMKTIYQVQYVTGGADSSSLAGEPVNVAGIVTAATGEYSDNYFFIQSSYVSPPEVPGFYGVKVYDRTGTVEVFRGDSVTVSGDVWEYFNETEIAMFFPEAVTIHTRNNAVPDRYPVTTASIETSESWEGVLVVAQDAVVKNADAGFGEWLISNGTDADTCRVGDYGDYAYVPQKDDLLNVTGTVMYAYKKYMLQPRDDDDICMSAKAGVTDDEARRPARLVMSVRPNPMMDGGVIRFSLPSSSKVDLKVYNVNGQLVRSLADTRAEPGNYRIEWGGTNSRGTRVTSGIYFLRLETDMGSLTNKVVISR